MSSTSATSVDHVALGIARMPSQWATSANMLAMLRVYLARYNVLEGVFQDLLLKRSIDTANADDPTGTVGDQLDQLGAKVGQPRNGLTNADYRRYIRARIATNNSNGRIEDFIAIAMLIAGDPAAYVQVMPRTNSSVEVGVWGTPVNNSLANILIEFLRQAVDAGGRVLLLSSPTGGSPGNPGGSFMFGFGSGFGTSFDAAQPTLVAYGTTGVNGGHLADVRE